MVASAIATSPPSGNSSTSVEAPRRSRSTAKYSTFTRMVVDVSRAAPHVLPPRRSRRQGGRAWRWLLGDGAHRHRAPPPGGHPDPPRRAPPPLPQHGEVQHLHAHGGRCFPRRSEVINRKRQISVG